MAFNAADLLAIKAELTNDPLTLGLTTNPADDEANANKLNEVRAECAIDREAIPTHEIFLQIDRDEYAALSANDRDWIRGITAGGTVNPKSGGEVREGLLQIFSAQSETRANLLEILTEPASRITQLYKAGTLSQGGIVTPSDVANARQAT